MEAVNEKALSFQLQEVYKQYISLDKNSKKESIQDFKEVVSNVLKELKNIDKLFNKMFTELFYTGSYYDGVRVSEASEFDLDVVLKLPICADKVKIDIRGVPPGFIKINVSDELQKLRQHAEWTNVYRFIDGWMTKDGLIEEEKVRIWFESILTKCLNFKSEWKDDSGNFYKVKMNKSGPAMTLQIERSRGSKIDVDLVPVIEFHYPKWPNTPVRQCNQDRKSWFVVPKKKKEASKSYWRLAFPRQEYAIFERRGNLKTMLKLLKKLRDVEKWTFLSSYYIKTIFLWEVENQEYSFEFWSKSIGFLFLHMLNRLQASFEKREIKFYWHKDCNLLGDANPRAIDNANFKLKNIIKSLTKVSTEPRFVENLLVTAEDKERVKNLYTKDSGLNLSSFEVVTLNKAISNEYQTTTNNQPADSGRCSVQ